MAEETEKNTDSTEPTFKLNYISAILLLVLLIPAGYTIWANLQSPPPPPEIPKAQIPAQTPPANNTPTPQAEEAALKRIADKPDYDGYVNLGMVYYGSAKYEDAIKAWNKAIALNPKSAIAYNDIAAAYGAMSNWDEEIKACEKALSIDPNMTLAKNNMNWAKSQKSKN
jgi:tetratricopeptide (TPR) repeat protein